MPRLDGKMTIVTRAANGISDWPDAGMHERAVDRLIAHLRAQVAELAREQGEGGEPQELSERSRVITRLADLLATVFADVEARSESTRRR